MSSTWIESILELMERHGIAEFEYQDEARHIVASGGEVVASGSEVVDVEEQADVVPVSAPRAETVTAPHIGVFLQAHPLDSKGAALPRLVRRGEIIGYLKAAGLLRPVAAPSEGVLVRCLVDEGTLVGFATPLFAIQAAELRAATVLPK